MDLKIISFLLVAGLFSSSSITSDDSSTFNTENLIIKKANSHSVYDNDSEIKCNRFEDCRAIYTVTYKSVVEFHGIGWWQIPIRHTETECSGGGQFQCSDKCQKPKEAEEKTESG